MIIYYYYEFHEIKQSTWNLIINMEDCVHQRLAFVFSNVTSDFKKMGSGTRTGKKESDIELKRQVPANPGTCQRQKRQHNIHAFTAIFNIVRNTRVNLIDSNLSK